MTRAAFGRALHFSRLAKIVALPARCSSMSFVCVAGLLCIEDQPPMRSLPLRFQQSSVLYHGRKWVLSFLGCLKQEVREVLQRSRLTYQARTNLLSTSHLTFTHASTCSLQYSFHYPQSYSSCSSSSLVATQWLLILQHGLSKTFARLDLVLRIALAHTLLDCLLSHCWLNHTRGNIRVAPLASRLSILLDKGLSKG